MTRLPMLAALSAISLVAASPVIAASAAPEDLRRAAADYDKAQIKSDGAELRRLLADDYVLVNGAGEVETKATFVAESTDPHFKLNPYVVEHPIETVWSNGAVLAGEVHLSGVSDGKPFSGHTRFADIWAKRAGRWVVVFTQVTRIPGPPSK